MSPAFFLQLNKDANDDDDVVADESLKAAMLLWIPYNNGANEDSNEKQDTLKVWTWIANPVKCFVTYIHCNYVTSRDQDTST